jgi:hypothetical protein
MYDLCNACLQTECLGKATKFRHILHISALYAHKYDNLNSHNSYHGEHGKVSCCPFTDRVLSPSPKCYIAWLIGAPSHLDWTTCQLWLTFPYLYKISACSCVGGGGLMLHMWRASVLCCSYRSIYNCPSVIVTSSQTCLNMSYLFKEKSVLLWRLPVTYKPTKAWSYSSSWLCLTLT